LALDRVRNMFVEQEAWWHHYWPDTKYAGPFSANSASRLC
jgi:hypothetical protein